jgi:hypothetical protein
MTKIAIRTIAAAMSAITLGSSAPMAVGTTDPQVAMPTSSVTYTTELSDNDGYTIATAETAVNINSIDSTPAPAVTESEIASVGTPISAWYAKPGDQKVYDNGLVISFDHFQLVTETMTEDGWNKLYGWTIENGDWEYYFTDQNAYGVGELPFTVSYDGAAIGLPIASGNADITIDGFKFDDSYFTYSHGPGIIYVDGNGWSAMILDSTRYAEVKYGAENGNFPDRPDWTLATYSSDRWVMAKGDYPEISKVDSKIIEPKQLSDFDKLCAKLYGAMPLAGVSDITYGVIEWDPLCTEDFGNQAYIFDAELSGKKFKLEIDGADFLGFAEKCSWSAAIVPSDFVTRQNDCILYYENYAISAFGSEFCVTDLNTGESRNIKFDDERNQETAVVVFTVTDGKHATCFTARPELISAIWALAK